MIGLIIIIWEIFIYRKTIIPLWIPLTIIGVIGAYTTWRNFKNYIAAYPVEGTLFFASIQNTVAWGFTICSLFMLSNYYLANSKSRTRTFNIEDRDSMVGRKYHRDERKPLIIINYDGQYKELVFSSQHFTKLDEYKQVTLVTKNGLFGFDIIVDQHLY